MTRLPCALSALAIEKSTALPRPPPASSTLLVLGNLGRRAGRPHDDDRLARLQIRAQPARHAHLERDQRQQALLAIDPRAGQRDAFHQQRRAVTVDLDVRAQPLEILQPVELPGMEVTRRGGRPHDHFDDRRRQPDDPLDARQQLRRRAAPIIVATALSRAGCAVGIERGDLVLEQPRPRAGSHAWPTPSP